MGILPNCVCVNIIVWMHQMDANETHGEKARWEPYKNAKCSFEQILKTTPNKKKQLYGHLPPISKTIHLSQRIHAREASTNS